MTRTSWTRNVFQPLVVGGMVGCVAVALVDLVHLVNPAWNGTYLVVVCVLAALEANYSHRLQKRIPRVNRNPTRFRAIELALFLILIKVGSYIGDGWAAVWADLRTWPTQPLNIFTNETMIAFALAFSSWLAATQTTRDLDRLDDSPTYHHGEITPGQSITDRFFAGGALLLIVTGLSRLTFEMLLDLDRPSVPGLVLNVLVYFLLGLVLLGQVQYTAMRRRWHLRKIRITDKLAARWVRYSLVFLGLTALIAFVLPTGYTMGFLETMGNVVGILLAIFQFVFNLIVFILTIPVWLLLLLIKDVDAPPPPAPEFSLEPAEPVAATGGAALPWFEILRSVVFWIVALGVVFYIVRAYLRDHPEVRKALSSLWLVRVLSNIFTALWRRLTGLAQNVAERIPRRLTLRRRAGRALKNRAFRFFRLGALSPRERTLYYYLSILRRAGQQGFRRKDSQTPYEYDTTLEPHLPQARQEMGLLTDDFVEARYSPHPIDKEREKQVRSRWQKVRAAVQALKREKEKTSEN